MEINLDDRFSRMLLRLPFSWDWVIFKDEQVFAGINYEETVRVGRPMIDIYYCATKALNGIVEQTVQYDKNKFKLPSHDPHHSRREGEADN